MITYYFTHNKRYCSSFEFHTPIRLAPGDVIDALGEWFHVVNVGVLHVSRNGKAECYDAIVGDPE